MTKKTRLNIPIDLEISQRLDSRAEQMGVSKAGLVRIMIYDYFKELDAMDVLKQIDGLQEMMGLVNKEK